MPEPIYWLHISDLHCGQPGGHLVQAFLRHFRAEFPGILRKRNLPYPDLIIISGDLTYSGKEKEFAEFDQVLAKIRSLWPEGGPQVAMVPGNHDRRRYAARAHTTAFAAYMRNWCRHMCGCTIRNCEDRGQCATGCRYRQRNIGIICSPDHPGDYCLRLAIPGKFPVAILGLNSERGPGRGSRVSIAVRLRNLKKLIGKLVLPEDRRVLIMHHPPSAFQPDIYRQFTHLFGHLDICLHGHQHRNRSVVRMVSDRRTENQYQVASLCGLRCFGTSHEVRSFGFSIGSLSMYGAIRVWPFSWLDQPPARRVRHAS